MKEVYLNFGCGEDYKSGWINIDFNKEVKADVYHNLDEFPYPFEDNCSDHILMTQTLEHLKDFFKVMDELWRIGKPNSTIEIYVPHYSGIYAFRPFHYLFFSSRSFLPLQEKPTTTGERYSKARFKVKTELIYFYHDLKEFKFLNWLPINWLFNFNENWQMIMEKFSGLKFDEIKFTLKVIK